jgi:hypothetical protein
MIALGFVEFVGDVNSLATPVEFMRRCEICESEQIFTASWECDRGLVGCCRGCGDEKVVPFTRANSEM